jgi:hypothetical protein
VNLMKRFKGAASYINLGTSAMLCGYAVQWPDMLCGLCVHLVEP